jgi:phosphopantetheinyl transferase (holo-ACP synthase)
MSAASIWRNAPSTIRHGRPPKPTNVKGTHNDEYDSTQNTFTAQPKSQAAPVTHPNSSTPIRQGNSTTIAHDHGNHFPPIRSPPNSSTSQRYTNHTFARPLDDNTTATFHSTASATLNSSHHAHRFAELEASIKANQIDLKKMNKQYDTMETRILETMSACHDNSKQLVVMQGQLNNLQNTMHAIADQMNQITHHFTQSARQQDAEPYILRSPAKKKLRKGIDTTITPQIHSDTDTDTAKPQRRSESPTSRRNYDDNTTDDTNKSADLEDAQYTQPSSPGTAMEE